MNEEGNDDPNHPFRRAFMVSGSNKIIENVHTSFGLAFILMKTLTYYMYKRTTSEPKGEVARVKLV